MLPPISQDDVAKVRNKIESCIIVSCFFRFCAKLVILEEKQLFHFIPFQRKFVSLHIMC